MIPAYIMQHGARLPRRMPRRPTIANPARMPLAQLLRRIRGQRTQAEIGEQLGHEQTWCARVENGLSSIEIHEAQAWARLCGRELALVEHTPRTQQLDVLAALLDDDELRLLERTARALRLAPGARRRLAFDLDEWEGDAAEAIVADHREHPPSPGVVRGQVGATKGA